MYKAIKNLFAHPIEFLHIVKFTREKLHNLARFEITPEDQVSYPQLSLIGQYPCDFYPQLIGFFFIFLNRHSGPIILLDGENIFTPACAEDVNCHTSETCA